MRAAATMAALSFLAALPGPLRSCDAPDCPGDEIVNRMLSDPALCGKGPTAVECQTTCPKDADHFVGNSELLWEESAYLTDSNEGQAGMARPVDYWLLDSWFPGRLKFRRAPLGYGVPVHLPKAALRSSSPDLLSETTRMSAYLTVSDVRAGCVLWMDVVWSWTVRYLSGTFATDFEAAIEVTDRRGRCPDPGPGFPAVGEAWKVGGRLKRPG